MWRGRGRERKEEGEGKRERNKGRREINRYSPRNRPGRKVTRKRINQKNRFAFISDFVLMLCIISFLSLSKGQTSSAVQENSHYHST